MNENGASPNNRGREGAGGRLMGVLTKLLGARQADPKAPARQEVVVYFSYGSTNLQHLYALEDSLRIALSDAAAGEYEGREIADDGSDGYLYMSGPDAEAVFRAISPVFAKTSFMRGAEVRLHFGPAKWRTPKRIIELP
jgi:hypothetical protein